MKKANAVLAVGAILAMAGHTGVMTYSLLTGWYSYPLCYGLGEAAILLLCLHGLVSVIILFFCHDGSAIGRYRRANIRTVLQRASSIVMAIFLHTHMTNYEFIAAGQALSSGDRCFRIVTELIFMAALLTHICTSFSKALITLGAIEKPKTLATIDRCVTTAAVISGLVFTYALVRFLLGWMA